MFRQTNYLQKIPTSQTLQMNRRVLLHAIILISTLSGVVIKADPSSPSELQYPPPEYASLRPSLAVVIGILTIMFVLTFLLLVYAKFCHRPREPEHINRGRNNNNINNINPTALISSSDRFSGIDKTVIESLPFFRFSALKGSREGLECSVCLSRFEDVEILRLLPKCRHAFHIDCIDFWLERHSTCPLCRHRVSSEDLSLIAYSNSMRFLRDHHEDSLESGAAGEVELFVQREGSGRGGSSRFSVGGSFRKIEKEEIVSISVEEDRTSTVLDKHKHRIMVSGFVMRNRWSNLTSSDLMFLNSEMLIDEATSSCEVVSGSKNGNEEIVKIGEEMEMKKSFESKVGAISTQNNDIVNVNYSESSVLSGCGERRSVSEITGVSRNRFGPRNGEKEERVTRVWLPIARRTVQWFANRQQRSHFPQQKQSLDV